MMQKQISNKKIIIYVCAAVAVIAAAVMVFLLNREETFRSILVYEVDGTALIEAGWYRLNECSGEPISGVRRPGQCGAGFQHAYEAGR